tara:strand:+ start:2190 stop:2450 length:261 start_codon:yes stop_codon:yes gene_type:complete
VHPQQALPVAPRFASTQKLPPARSLGGEVQTEIGLIHGDDEQFRFALRNQPFPVVMQIFPHLKKGNIDSPPVSKKTEFTPWATYTP